MAAGDSTGSNPVLAGAGSGGFRLPEPVTPAPQEPIPTTPPPVPAELGQGFEERTAAKRRALRALAAAKRRNVDRVARGEKPIVNGKKVSAASIGLTKEKAKRLQKERRKRK